MFLTMAANHIGNGAQRVLWLGMIEPVLQEEVSQKDDSKPLFRSLEGTHSEVDQTQMLFDVEVIYLNWPTLLVDVQYLLRGQRYVSRENGRFRWCRPVSCPGSWYDRGGIPPPPYGEFLCLSRPKNHQLTHRASALQFEQTPSLSRR
jgi:hypothetical protein